VAGLAAVSRNARSHRHTYDAKAPSPVASGIPAFVEEAEHLFTELQRRLA